MYACTVRYNMRVCSVEDCCAHDCDNVNYLPNRYRFIQLMQTHKHSSTHVKQVRIDWVLMPQCASVTTLKSLSDGQLQVVCLLDLPTYVRMYPCLMLVMK